MKNKTNALGLTLLEVLIALAIIGIVAAIATPNLSSWTKSRTVKKELAQLEALIDYGKAVSVNKSRKLYLRQTNTGALQMFQLQTGTDALNADNLNAANCVFNAGNTDAIREHPLVTNFESIVRAQHNNSAVAGVANTYSNATSLMCFYADGTTTGGGFELTNNCYSYRIDIWLTGFYAKQVQTNTAMNSGVCQGTNATWIERN